MESAKLPDGGSNRRNVGKDYEIFLNTHVTQCLRISRYWADKQDFTGHMEAGMWIKF